MKVGILGAGNLGNAIAKKLVKQRHQVFLSFSKDTARMVSFADSIGARFGSPQEAAQFGDVVVLAAPWGAVREALQQAGSLDGKIIWDCTSALKPDLSGLLIGTTTSAGEEVARLAPTAKIVKAIPPFAESLDKLSSTDRARPASFVCGDDRSAKLIISELIEHLGAEPVDAGPLSAARFAEPAAMLLVHLAYKERLGNHIGLMFLRY